MELHVVNHWLPLIFILLAVEANKTSYNVTESVREPRGSRRVVKQYTGTRPDPIVCTDEGFHADPNNCAVFYRCTKSGRGRYLSFKFQCAPGTIYDPDSEICNHPQNTKRSGCGGKVVPVNERNHENDVEDIRQELPSPIVTKQPIYTETSSVSSKKKMSTVFPWMTSSNIQNAGTTNVPKFPFRDPNKAVTPYSNSTKKQRPTPVTINRQSNLQDGDLCTSEGFMGDSENCRRFYRCIGNGRGGFIRYEFLCSESTVWDDDIQSCNHGWAVKRRRCGRTGPNDVIPVQKDKHADLHEGSTESKVTPTTIQEQLQINYGSQVTQTQTQIASGPVKQNQTQINYGNKSNVRNPSSVKQNQTQISNGSAISQSQVQINYGDKAMQTQLQIDHSNESSQSQTQIHETSSSTTSKQEDYDDDNNNGYNPVTSNPNQEVNTQGCSKSGFMGDRNNCKKFYRCVDNGKGGFTRYDFSCGEGTVWDAKLEACNHAWAVKECEEEQSQPVIESTQKTTQSPPSVTQTMITDDDEDVGYGNQNQIQSSTTSTTTTTTVKPPSTTSTTTTITSTDIGTTDSTKKPNVSTGSVCTKSGFMGDENDCKKFYRCVDNGNGGYTRYEFSCGEGTVWDPTVEACNHPWAVSKCGGSNTNDIEKIDTTTAKQSATSITTTTTTTSQMTSLRPTENDDYDSGYGIQQDELPSSSTTLSSSTTISSTSKQPQTNGNTCSSSGFMGDDNDCKKFYRCVDNGNGGFTRYEFTCGEGTVWDPKIEACNHVWAVEKCGGSINEDVNKEETTTRPQSTTTVKETTGAVNEDNNIDTGYGQQSNSPSTASTTEAPQENQEVGKNKCKSSGFMGDSKNCKKFYRCVDNGDGTYTRYEFTCGEGTVWDSEIEACNHEWAVKSCGSSNQQEVSIISTTHKSTTTYISTQSESTSDSNNDIDNGYGEQQQSTQSQPVSTTKKPTSTFTCTQEGFIGDKNDCKKFYRCVDNGQGGYTKYEFTCGDGTVWNQEVQTCDHESSSNSCNESLQKEPVNTESSQKEPEQQQDEMAIDNTTKGPSSESTETVQSSPRPGGNCKAEGFYANPDDCKKFYRCVDNGKGGFTKYDFTCGDGTVWDQEIQACNHESTNGCSATSVSGSTEESTSGTTSSTTSSSTEQQQTSEINQVSQNDECTSEGFFADSNDCKKFYRCVSNDKGGYTKYDFSCAQGTMWVQEIQGCYYEDDSLNCSSKTPKPQPSQDQQTTESQAQSSTAVSTSQEPDKQADEYPVKEDNAPTTQDEKCETEGFYPNKNDCRKFYRCVDDGQGGFTKYDFTCGEGTAWDTEIQTCNHINEVNRCQNMDTENKPSQNDTENKPMQDETTDSTVTTNSTTTTSTTTTTTESSGNGKPLNKDECKEEGYFGNTQDCTKFYRCVDNGNGGLTKYDFDCGEGTIWDQDVVTCNHPQDVQNPSCRNEASGSSESSSSSSTSSSPTSSSSGSSTASNSESSTESSSNCTQENSSKKPQKQDMKCEKAGYYANPNDCKKFYRCVDWDGDGKRFSIYHFDCGEGTIWDPELDTCNHEESVYPPRDCSGSQSQNENVQESSSTTESPTTSTEDSTTTTESTTQESTTQQSTSSEETTTQQTTTSEKTTTEQSTTEKTTTQKSTTESTTTQQSTTQGTTTQQSTTEGTTTQQSTTESTTQQATTAEETTTQQSTTEGTTTQQSTTSEQTTATEESTTTTTEQTTTTTTEQTTTTTTEQTTTTEESTTQKTTTESTTENTTHGTTDSSETTTEQSLTTQDSTTEKTESDNNSTTEQSSTDEQTTTESSDNQSTTEESTTTQQTDDNTTTEGDQDTTTEESSSSSKECPETEDDQYLYVCPTPFKRHPKYCNMFYQCTEDNDSHDLKIAVFKCPNNTIYDESQTQCLEEDKADKKCDGEIAQKRRFKRLHVYKEPIEVGRQKQSCSTTGYFPFEKDMECSSAFMKCQKTKSGQMRGYVTKCPEHYLYWSISKKCERIESIRDCRRSTIDWSRRWEIPIEQKNIAI